MKSALIAGKTAARYDPEIIDRLNLAKADVAEVKKEHLVLGVRNEAGEIYRVIGVTGLNKFLDTIEDMVNMGFLDEIDAAEDAQEEYEAILSKRTPQG